MDNKIHECEVCGHKGIDVEHQDNPYKSGYYCKNQEACFHRYQQLRNKQK